MHNSATKDSMASDSYLLQAPTAPPCQCQCQCKCQCHSKARTSTSCGVVVALVLLLAAVMALAALAFCQRADLLDMHTHVVDVHREFLAASRRLDWLQKYEQMKAYEAEPSPTADSPGGTSGDEDGSFDQDDDEDYDEYDPIYPDDEDTNVVEGKARGLDDDAGAALPRLEPASGHKQDAAVEDVTAPVTAPVTAATVPDAAATTFKDDGPLLWGRRRRRDVGRPQPQLKLYHMLQTPGLSAAAPPADQWSQHGARYPQGHPYGLQSRPQPMYAEHAPMSYVTPPQRHFGTSTPAPVASRRSRVMDGMVAPGHQQHQHQQQQQQHRRRHQHLQQRQRGFQPLQDVTQEVPQRSVEVGRPRWQQQRLGAQQASPAWPSPSSTPRPPSWSTERPGRAGWREQWQDRVRATRVTEPLQR